MACTYRCFTQPLKTKEHLQTLKVKGFSFAIRLVLLLLLVAQGIESKPGPGPNDARGQGSPRGRGSDRGWGPRGGRPDSYYDIDRIVTHTFS